MTKLSPFHLAIPVKDLSESKNFYQNILGCKPGRESDEWADYDFFGHQLVIHVDPNHIGNKHHNEVDGKSVPIPHFGVIIPWDDFDNFAESLIIIILSLLLSLTLDLKDFLANKKLCSFMIILAMHLNLKRLKILK